MELPRKKDLRRDLSGMGLVYLLAVLAVLVGFFFRVQISELIDVRAGESTVPPNPPYMEQVP